MNQKVKQSINSLSINQSSQSINGVLSHSALQGCTGLGTTWANEMNFDVNHAPGAGLIARPVDQQSSVLPLCHGCPLYRIGGNNTDHSFIAC